MTVVLTGNF